MNILKTLRRMMWGAKSECCEGVCENNLADVIRNVENELNVNLTSSSTRQSVNTRRVVVNVILDRTGWTATEMADHLKAQGVTGQGWSRRSLSWYKTTTEEILTTSPGEAAVYSRNYQLISSLI